MSTHRQKLKSRKPSIPNFAATVEALVDGGAGIVRVPGDNTPVFVGRVCPGDRIEVEVYDQRKGFAFGKAVNLLEPGSQRQEPPCKLFKVCGGCQWQHITYEGQLAVKRDLVRQALQRIGGLDAEHVAPCLPAPNPLFYRNKVQYPVAQPRDSSRILAGYYKEGSHELVNIKHCPVQPEPFDRMLAAVKTALENQGFGAYDETAPANEPGSVRHIIGRHSTSSGELLVTLVVNAEAALLPEMTSALKAVAQEIMQSVSEIKGVCVNFNPDKGNRIIGTQTRHIAGVDHITECLRSQLPVAPARLRDGINFRISPVSFFQINSAQAQVLLDQVLAQSGLLQGDSASKVVIDAYAGVGTISAWLAAAAGKVIAIEDFAPAVADGQINLKDNNIENVEFRLGRVEEVVPELASSGLAPHVVVVDPPRKGVDAGVLTHLVKLAPERFVYVSCNPATLARDLKILTASGYKLMGVQPLDMFPQTYHVESVTLLQRA